jgi:hypothetical protein
VATLQARLKSQLLGARTPIWSGYLTRYLSQVSVGGTWPSTGDAYGDLTTIFDVSWSYLLGASSRVTWSVVDSNAAPDTDASSRRDSERARLSGDGKFVVFDSDADLSDGDSTTTWADGVHHVWRVDLATGTKINLTPNQPSGDDSKYAASSQDGRVICFVSNMPSQHPSHVGSDQNHVWVAVANADGATFSLTQLSYSSASGRKVYGGCEITPDGKSVFFSSDSAMTPEGDFPASSGDYQVWKASVEDGSRAP